MKKFSILFLAFLIANIFAFGQKIGDKVQVEWKGKYYPCTVKDVKDNQWFIHYDGWGDNFDEWVGKDRIKAGWKIGDKIQVEWKGKWYASTVLEISKDGKYKIHYDGWGDNFDEWVTPARMKNR